MIPITGDSVPSYDPPLAGESGADRSDSTRLQKAHALDRNTLGGIYDEFHQQIYKYIYRRIGDIENSRDLTSEVFRRFLQAIHNGNGPRDNLRAWLYKVAHNIVVDYYRRQQNQALFPWQENLIGAEDDPGRAAEFRLEAEKVREAISQLTADQQQVITLKFLEGMSNKEVAEITGKPVGAVKSLQHRALASLQRQLITSDEEVPI